MFHKFYIYSITLPCFFYNLRIFFHYFCIYSGSSYFTEIKRVLSTVKFRPIQSYRISNWEATSYIFEYGYTCQSIRTWPFLSQTSSLYQPHASWFICTLAIAFKSIGFKAIVSENVDRNDICSYHDLNVPIQFLEKISKKNRRCLFKSFLFQYIYKLTILASCDRRAVQSNRIVDEIFSVPFQFLRLLTKGIAYLTIGFVKEMWLNKNIIVCYDTVEETIVMYQIRVKPRNLQTLSFVLRKFHPKMLYICDPIPSSFSLIAPVLSCLRIQRDEAKIHCLRNYKPLRAC